MKTRVKKWGNSLALRIPGAMAREAGFAEEGDVEISVSGGKLVVAPALRKKYDLRELLGKVKKSNLHKETGTGKPKGREEW